MTDTEYVPRWQLDAALAALREISEQLDNSRKTVDYLLEKEHPLDEEANDGDKHADA